MPAVSKAQKKFFGVVKNAQENPDADVTKNVKQVADKMSKKDVDDFASTPEKGLPEKAKDESVIREMIKEVIREVLRESKKKK